MTERQSARMSKIKKNCGLDQYGPGRFDRLILPQSEKCGTERVKSPLVTMARPKFAPKIPLPVDGSQTALYLPHPWTCPTYDAKRHPDPIRRFFRQRTGQTDRPTDTSFTGKFNDYYGKPN